jgi:hypothetical protein
MIQRYGLMLCTALVGATLLVGLATAADKAAEKTPITPGLQTVEGDVLKDRGGFLCTKGYGRQGNPSARRQDHGTGRPFKAGDQIEARATERTTHCPLNTHSRRRCRC